MRRQRLGGEIPCSRPFRQNTAESGLNPGSSDLCLELLQIHLGLCSLGAYDFIGNKTDRHKTKRSLKVPYGSCPESEGPEEQRTSWPSRRWAGKASGRWRGLENGLQQRAGRAVGNGRREDRVSLGQGMGRSEGQSEWPIEQMSQSMVCLTSLLLRRRNSPQCSPSPRYKGYRTHQPCTHLCVFCQLR